MGISRSKVRRSNLKTNSNKMANTIKRLKHSLAFKDRRIKELEDKINAYEELYSLSKGYYSWLEYVESTYRNLKGIVVKPLKEVYQSIESASSLIGYNERKVAKLMEEINNYNKKDHKS